MRRADAATRYVGLDVHLARGCPLVAIDEEGRHVTSTWLEPSTGAAAHAPLAARLRGCVEGLAVHHRASSVPSWMALGFACFEALAGLSREARASADVDVGVLEVFPPASGVHRWPAEKGEA